MFVCRVSRRADADPLIQELNVGDAAEPEGRGTGQLSLKPERKTLDNIFFISFIMKCYNLLGICDISASCQFGRDLQRHSLSNKHQF